MIDYTEATEYVVKPAGPQYGSVLCTKLFGVIYASSSRYLLNFKYDGCCLLYRITGRWHVLLEK